MTGKRPEMHNFFKPIGSSSQPDEHDGAADVNNVQASEENQDNPDSVEVDAQTENNISGPEVREQATIITTEYDLRPR